MGDLIRLSAVHAARRLAVPARQRPRAEFFFDLACPFSYLAAERVEHGFERVTWRPASAAALQRVTFGDDPVHTEMIRAAAERRARALRVPLVWPERFGSQMPAAMRAASYAADHGRGAAFVLAAGRLAYCGGFDLEDPEALAEAAAAAGVPLEGCLEAAGDAARDGRIEAAGRRLLAVGADRLPALRVGRTLVWGERKVADAAAAARMAATARP
jgi:2-hydroxychromene-2-carboxylate isomerase